jgi:protocatechuate 3,4-dioxygenase alpha subunit
MSEAELGERGPTPSQTAGPFVSIGTGWMVETFVSDSLSSQNRHPDAIEISGDVRDGNGDPVGDAMIEFWQADPEGRFPPESPPGWRGFGRALTGPDGGYVLVTLAPGSVPDARGAMQAPHIDVSIFARGLVQRLVTRIYLPGDTESLSSDPVLATVPEADRHRLIAREGRSGKELAFDIRFQGDEETVFFEPW